MTWIETFLSMVLLAAGPVSVGTAGCPHHSTTEIAGWCGVHQVGWIGSVEITSKLLFDTLDAHGHDVDPATFSCDTCRDALASNGFCEKHRIGFVARQAYFSRLTYELARGRRTDETTPTCPVCARNSETHGWCDACRVGRIGHILIDDRNAYEQVRAALSVLAIAQQVAATCEHCAVAIVTDTECPVCRIRYQNGRSVSDARSGTDAQ